VFSLTRANDLNDTNLKYLLPELLVPQPKMLLAGYQTTTVVQQLHHFLIGLLNDSEVSQTATCLIVLDHEKVFVVGRAGCLLTTLLSTLQ
jgi:hypothetical protein